MQVVISTIVTITRQLNHAIVTAKIRARTRISTLQQLKYSSVRNCIRDTTLTTQYVPRLISSVTNTSSILIVS